MPDKPISTYVVGFVYDGKQLVILVQSYESTPEALASDLEGRARIDRVLWVSKPLWDTLDNLDYKSPIPFGVEMFNIRRESKFDYYANLNKEDAE